MNTVKHHGRNVKRIRDILGIKQETPAIELGVNQQRISAIEAQQEIKDPLLRQLAEILKVPVEAILNFDEEAAINIVANTVTNNDQASFFCYMPTFNPIEKWLETIEENKKLYEQLLKSEREKIALLEKMLNSKN